jgi:hypothetical protein
MKQRDITPYNILKKNSSGSKNGGKDSESENKNGNFTFLFNSEITVFYRYLYNKQILMTYIVVYLHLWNANKSSSATDKKIWLLFQLMITNVYYSNTKKVCNTLKLYMCFIINLFFHLNELYCSDTKKACNILLLYICTNA